MEMAMLLKSVNVLSSDIFLRIAETEGVSEVFIAFYILLTQCYTVVQSWYNLLWAFRICSQRYKFHDRRFAVSNYVLNFSSRIARDVNGVGQQEDKQSQEATYPQGYRISGPPIHRICMLHIFLWSSFKFCVHTIKIVRVALLLW